MADRRDDAPLAPRRPLSGPEQQSGSSGDADKKPLTQRVSAAVAAAGTAVQSAASGSSTRSGTGGGSTSTSRSGTSTGSTGSTRSAPASASRSASRSRGIRRARLRLHNMSHP